MRRKNLEGNQGRDELSKAGQGREKEKKDSMAGRQIEGFSDSE